MDFGIGLWTLDLDFGVRLWTQTLDLDLDCDKNNNTPYFKKDDEERLSLKTFYTCLNSSEACLFVLFEASSNVVTLDDCCSVASI